MAGKLYDAAFGSKRTAQNREAAVFLDRIRERAQSLPGRVFRWRREFPRRDFGRKRSAHPCSSPASLKALSEQAHAARVEHVRRGESASGFQIGEHGSLRGNFVEFVERQAARPRRARWRADAARRSSSRRWRRRTRSHSASDACVMICFGRISFFRSSITSFAAIERDLRFARIDGRNFVCAHRRNSEKRDRRRHRVGGELAAARARAGTRAVFEFA